MPNAIRNCASRLSTPRLVSQLEIPPRGCCFPVSGLFPSRGQRSAVPCSEVMLPVLGQVLHNFWIADKPGVIAWVLPAMFVLLRYAGFCLTAREGIAARYACERM